MAQFYDICLVLGSKINPRNCSTNKCLLHNDREVTHLLVGSSKEHVGKHI
jgi:hypothetical protein